MKQRASIDGCPFAVPGPPPSVASEGFYCRLPGGRVHIPTPDEIRRFCATRGYTECPVNQRWMPASRSEPV